MLAVDHLHPDFLWDYSDAAEEMDPAIFILSIGDPLLNVIMVDSDHHAPDLVTHTLSWVSSHLWVVLLSYTFVGGNPFIWFAKWQGAVVR